MGMKITLAGDQGSGKSTVAKLLLEATGATYYSTGAYARAYAQRMGMDVNTFGDYTQAHPEIDYEIDSTLKPLTESEGDYIIDSRMAWHFVQGSFTVFLFADRVEAARRIFKANRVTEKFSSLEEAIIDIGHRRQVEIERYSDLYHVNIYDPENYALLVDTTHATPAQIADRILEGYRIWEQNKNAKMRFICPATLLYPDDETDAEALAKACLRIETGEPLTPCEVVQKDGNYYLVSHTETAVAGAMFDLPHIPFVLVDELPSDPNLKYVKMENLLSC